ncbi:hypothetical protein C5C36_15585 [Rathayibacter sp. AY1G1]|jgi:hypothetical protein|uniref:hypothetical protein n=1 Tax=unclassified Rathayibacter TaxID=2609250 RepID=UPI000CE7C39D|nr:MULTISPECIES: hypothetical protein [unclassified Rathayibacter]PPF25830.1 hypothetical protein C5C54_14365 [Rathayibacter sp. AY1F2]PPF46328.1 hypothetical protein C5E14_11400 [Rathayibacter sp. AY1A1]PPF69113.1 hypothetical protein C5C46_13620 [Rathayibacter sp. AY1E6]PPG08992.1 hypothetical protein C5C26_06960 [Rathayibacter sp. AY2B1]PPG13257.1 hypothetical protein C5D36_13695 [Rathayibacter sp. AY1C6]
MKRLATSGQLVGWTIALLGAAGAAAFLVHWSSCLGGLNEGCYSATQSDFTWIATTIVWAVAFPLVIFGAFVLSPGRPVTLIGVGLLMVINPLTDPGAFFLPWDVADTLPFTGVATSLAAVTAGVLLAGSSYRARRPDHSRVGKPAPADVAY